MKVVYILLFVSVALFSCKKETENPEIVNISEPTDLTIDYGKSPEIPTQVEVKYNDGTSKYLFISWDGIINTLKPGTQKLTGKIITDPNISEVKEKTFCINVRVNDKSATAAPNKWPKDYLFDSYSNNGEWKGNAVNTDMMDYYEKDIYSYDYFYRVITNNEELKYAQDFMFENYNRNLHYPELKPNTVIITFFYTYRCKTISADTLKPLSFIESANKNIQSKDYNQFRINYGEKYSTEGILMHTYYGYYVFHSIDEKPITQEQIIRLYKFLDLNSSYINSDLGDLSSKDIFTNSTLLLKDFGNLTLLNSMQDRYNKIKATIESKKSDKSFIKDAYFSPTRFNKYSFLK